MRLGYKYYSRLENRRARERMKLLDPVVIEKKLSIEDRFWTIPLLLRLMERVDVTAESLPAVGLVLAMPLPMLASRIPVRPSQSHYYASKAEKQDFKLLAGASLFSAQSAAGEYSVAKKSAQVLLGSCEGASEFARAEVRRRASCVALETGELEWALGLATDSALAFHRLNETELAALAHVHRGNVLNLIDRPGAGSTDYARSLYLAAQTNSARSRRTITAAAGNLARDAFFGSPDPKEVYSWAAAARDAMKGRPTNAAKVRVQWAEALAAYRFGVGRYSMRQLERARDLLIELGAVSDAVTCTADLATLANEIEPEALPEIAVRAEAAFEKATTDPDSVATLEKWVSRPSDVALLRRSVSLRQPGTSRSG